MSESVKYAIWVYSISLCPYEHNTYKEHLITSSSCLHVNVVYIYLIAYTVLRSHLEFLEIFYNS